MVRDYMYKVTFKAVRPCACPCYHKLEIRHTKSNRGVCRYCRRAIAHAVTLSRGGQMLPAEHIIELSLTAMGYTTEIARSMLTQVKNHNAPAQSER